MAIVTAVNHDSDCNIFFFISFLIFFSRFFFVAPRIRFARTTPLNQRSARSVTSSAPSTNQRTSRRPVSFFSLFFDWPAPSDCQWHDLWRSDKHHQKKSRRNPTNKRKENKTNKQTNKQTNKSNGSSTLIDAPESLMSRTNKNRVEHPNENQNRDTCNKKKSKKNSVKQKKTRYNLLGSHGFKLAKTR